MQHAGPLNPTKYTIALSISIQDWRHPVCVGDRARHHSQAPHHMAGIAGSSISAPPLQGSASLGSGHHKPGLGHIRDPPTTSLNDIFQEGQTTYLVYTEKMYMALQF